MIEIKTEKIEEFGQMSACFFVIFYFMIFSDFIF